MFGDVSTSAVISRINRKLAEDGDVRVRVARGARQELDLGRFYAVDVRRNAIAAKHVELEAYARELGVLRNHERLVDPEV